MTNEESKAARIARYEAAFMAHHGRSVYVYFERARYRFQFSGYREVAMTAADIERTTDYLAARPAKGAAQ